MEGVFWGNLEMCGCGLDLSICCSLLFCSRKLGRLEEVVCLYGTPTQDPITSLENRPV